MSTKIIKRITAILMIVALLFSFSLIQVLAAGTEEIIYKQSLRDKGFPESYLNSLWAMHQKYPNWVFQPLKTGLNFDDAVAGESVSGSSTVSTSGTYWMLISKCLGTYNSNGTYNYEYVDGSHVDATTLATSYFMDPRNFIGDETTIFQFEDNAYPDYLSETEISAAIDKIVAGTFLAATDSATSKTYTRILIEAGSTYDINPCYLASKILQEVGRDGTNSAISGTVSGYEGYYNYYNIGATADGGSGDNVIKGLQRAKTEGWNTREKAIHGGAEFLAERYIGVGQSNAYLTKFNVNPATWSHYAKYTHQYMSAIHDPAQSANPTYAGYKDANSLQDVHTFLIPIYNNMPDFTDTQLKLNDSPSSYTAKEPGGASIIYVRNGPYYGASVAGRITCGNSVAVLGRYRSTKRASGSTGNLYLYQLYNPFWYKVGENEYTAFENLATSTAISLKVGATKTLGYTTSPSVSNAVRFTSIDSRIASVDAKTGAVTAKGVGTTQILAYTAAGSVDYITINVSVGDVPAKVTSPKYTVSESNAIISGVAPGTSISTLLSGINEKSYCAVYSGTTKVTSGVVKTGMTLKIMNGSVEVKSYGIAVKGDANGDGYVKTGDAVVVLKYIAGTTTLNGAYLLAADANGDGGVKTGDAVTILKSIS